MVFWFLIGDSKISSSDEELISPGILEMLVLLYTDVFLVLSTDAGLDLIFLLDSYVLCDLLSVFCFLLRDSSV